MIKHIVLWRLNEAYSEKEKAAHIQTMQQELLSLKGKINELRSIAVYSNHDKAADSNHDLILDTEFNTLNDLSSYQVHPEHQAVVKSLGAIKKERAAIDYEF